MKVKTQATQRVARNTESDGDIGSWKNARGNTPQDYISRWAVNIVGRE